MSKQYTRGGQMHRCPECEVNWYESTEVRSYNEDTGKDVLLSVTPGEEHPNNGCSRWQGYRKIEVAP